MGFTKIKLRCPMCGGEGRLVQDSLASWGVKCNNCNYAINTLYTHAEGAIHQWLSSFENINKYKEKQIKNTPVDWYDIKTFPDIEGQYIVRTPEPENFIFIKYIDLYDGEWVTASLKPIKEYPPGTMFYGPIPHWEDPNYNLGILNIAVKPKKKQKLACDTT